MFAYIKGNLETKTDSYVVVDVGGIGYKIFMSLRSIENIGETGQIVKVYTHYYVREDDIRLYGFTNNEELRMFELLLSVSGIGAKSAIGMLSEISPSSFALAIISDDISQMVKIPGIGKKTAARIVLELKDKLKTEEAIAKNEETANLIKESDRAGEAMAALQVLGYSAKEVAEVLKTIECDKLNVEDIIRQALRVMGK